MGKYLQEVEIIKIDPVNPPYLWVEMMPGLMKLEDLFPDGLQEDEEDKRLMLQKDTISCFFAFHDHQVIGEAYTLRTHETYDSDDDKHLSGVFDKCATDNGVYLYSIAIAPEWQGKDIGKRLMMKILTESKNKGYKVLFSHSREGGSTHLHKFFGAVQIEARPDWYETGETYYLNKIDLDPLKMIDFDEPYQQETNYDCGVACVQAVLNHYGIKTDYIDIMEKTKCIAGEGTEHADILNVLLSFGRNPTIITTTEGLCTAINDNRPVILCVLCPGVYEGHYLILVGYSDKNLYVQDVDTGNFGRMSYDELDRVWWNNIDKNKWAVSA
jgi:GNAT superfamily N-acetyltransferase